MNMEVCDLADVLSVYVYIILDPTKDFQPFRSAGIVLSHLDLISYCLSLSLCTCVHCKYMLLRYRILQQVY